MCLTLLETKDRPLVGYRNENSSYSQRKLALSPMPRLTYYRPACPEFLVSTLCKEEGSCFPSRLQAPLGQ